MIAEDSDSQNDNQSFTSKQQETIQKKCEQIAQTLYEGLKSTQKHYRNSLIIRSSFSTMIQTPNLAFSTPKDQEEAERDSFNIEGRGAKNKLLQKQSIRSSKTSIKADKQMMVDKQIKMLSQMVNGIEEYDMKKKTVTSKISQLYSNTPISKSRRQYDKALPNKGLPNKGPSNKQRQIIEVNGQIIVNPLKQLNNIQKKRNELINKIGENYLIINPIQEYQHGIENKNSYLAPHQNTTRNNIKTSRMKQSALLSNLCHQSQKNTYMNQMQSICKQIKAQQKFLNIYVKEFGEFTYKTRNQKALKIHAKSKKVSRNSNLNTKHQECKDLPNYKIFSSIPKQENFVPVQFMKTLNNFETCSPNSRAQTSRMFRKYPQKQLMIISGCVTPIASITRRIFKEQNGERICNKVKKMEKDRSLFRSNSKSVKIPLPQNKFTKKQNELLNSLPSFKNVIKYF